jgi:hypothetical protein
MMILLLTTKRIILEAMPVAGKVEDFLPTFAGKVEYFLPTLL